MPKKVAICPVCQTKIATNGKPGQKVKVKCSNCGKTGTIVFKAELQQLDFYPLYEPFAYAKVMKNPDTLEKSYKVIEPYLNEEEHRLLNYIWETLLKTLELRLDELDLKKVEKYLDEQIELIFENYQIKADDLTKKKILYYIKRESLGYGKIDPLMKDPNIEDISCDGSGIPIFLYHRKYGSVESNVYFTDEDELSYFVVRLAQKCGKHISIAEPMLDATIPDGSRIQMTLSTEVTTKGSTFTIRRFKADPITPPDLITFNTVSSEILAYFWMGVENRVNALIAGGTASGKTTVLNALSLFIPRDSKIVSIEETREINLPNPNWIPGVSRSGFGEIVSDKMVGEIDLYDLMKAALRQRPEYILVGEIRGKEAYVLFQAMATGHATYSTVHADSAKSLIHRLEGKPIDIPRVMLQSLDIVSIHITTRVKGKRVRRCKQIIEILDVDPTTKEILTNEVFRWDPIEDKFIYTGKSYILEGIRARWDMSKEDISDEIRRRAEILEWMKDKSIRSYNDVGKIIVRYNEKPLEFYKQVKEEIKRSSQKNQKSKNKSKIKSKGEVKFEEDGLESDQTIDSDSIKNLKSIDEKTAKKLIAKGIKTIEKLKSTQKKDLMKIKGIKKKKIEEIFKDIKTLEKKDFDLNDSNIEKTKTNTIEKEAKGDLQKPEKEELEPEKQNKPKKRSLFKIPKIKKDAKIKEVGTKKEIYEQEKKVEPDKELDKDNDKLNTGKDIKDSEDKKPEKTKKKFPIKIPKIKKEKPQPPEKIDTKPQIEEQESDKSEPETEIQEGQFKKPEKQKRKITFKLPNIKKDKQKQTPPSKEKPQDVIKEEDIDLSEDTIKKIRVFEELKSIDNKIALALYDNGIRSVDDLKKASIKDLMKIKELNKRIVKRIIKDLKVHFNKQSSGAFDNGGDSDSTK